MAKAKKVVLKNAEEFHKRFNASLVDTTRLIRTPDQVLRTGSIKLDLQLRGGLRAGTISELYGPEGGGKTTVALTMAKIVLDAGGKVLYFDLEHGLDGGTKYPQGHLKGWMQIVGVDPNDPNFEVARPLTGEEIYSMIEESIMLSIYDLVILDSMAAISTRADMEDEIGGGAAFGPVAKLNAKALKRVLQAYEAQKVEKTHLMILNQARDNVKSTWGGTKSTSGRALRHYVSTKLQMRRTGVDKDSNVSMITIVTEKNRFSPPKESTMIYIHPNCGIDTTLELLELGLIEGFIIKKGSYYTIHDPDTGEELAKVQGRDKAKEALDADTSLKERITDIAWNQGLSKLLEADEE